MQKPEPNWEYTPQELTINTTEGVADGMSEAQKKQVAINAYQKKIDKRGPGHVLYDAAVEDKKKLTGNLDDES